MQSPAMGDRASGDEGHEISPETTRDRRQICRHRAGPVVVVVGSDTVAWEIAPPCVPERDPRQNEFAVGSEGASRGRIFLGSKNFSWRSRGFLSEMTNPKVPLPGGCEDDAGDSSRRIYESGEALKSSEQGDDDWVPEGRGG
ncbi:hypothetical protein TIFTF001_010774 [Ficus carica]|uniref:Uncharacterized protein n=1 Tax=Ficus carica TaxID=3494 RepID=A0AA87ZQN1_FICCA|nr:hypothetical protein TIFTF001_010774 [Ficus carica]